MTWLNFWVFFGLFGVIGHMMVQVGKHGGRTIGSLIQYMKDNSLSTLWAVICYVAAIAMWESGMLEGLTGLVPGRFNVLTLVVGYGATDIVGAVLKARLSKVNGSGTTYSGSGKAPDFNKP